MGAEQMTTSAALYFTAEGGAVVAREFFERASELFRAHKLSPVLFTADGGGFQLGDCCVLGDQGADIALWGETIPARGAELRRALSEGAIEDLFLDSPRSGADDREDWRAAVSVCSTPGSLYVGIDEDLFRGPSALLRCAYDIAKGLFDVRYGIAYRSPLAGRPDCYASGTPRTTYDEIVQMLRNRPERDKRTKNPVELWRDEFRGKGRHLIGLFRGAYPASILSDAHVRQANLRSRAIGRLSGLDASHWLWELSEDEMPSAHAALEAAGALVC